MRPTTARASTPNEDPRVQTLELRARRMRRRGEQRRAMLTLRQAAQEAGTDARLWTLYGVQCARIRRLDDALEALGHAAWLRERARDTARARVTHTLRAKLSEGGLASARFAA